MNRRSLLVHGGLLAVAAPIVGLSSRSFAETEQADAVSIVEHVSSTLRNNVSASLRNFVMKDQANRLAITDIRALSTSIASYTGALTDRGYSKAVQMLFAGNSASELMKYLSPVTVDDVLTYCKAVGISASIVNKGSYAFTESQVSAAKAYIAQYGVAGLNAAIQNALAAREDSMVGVTTAFSHTQYCFALAFVGIASVMSGDVVIAAVAGVLLTVQCT